MKLDFCGRSIYPWDETPSFAYVVEAIIDGHASLIGEILWRELKRAREG